MPLMMSRSFVMSTCATISICWPKRRRHIYRKSGKWISCSDSRMNRRPKCRRQSKTVRRKRSVLRSWNVRNVFLRPRGTGFWIWIWKALTGGWRWSDGSGKKLHRARNAGKKKYVNIRSGSGVESGRSKRSESGWSKSSRNLWKQKARWRSNRKCCSGTSIKRQSGAWRQTQRDRSKRSGEA